MFEVTLNDLKSHDGHSLSNNKILYENLSYLKYLSKAEYIILSPIKTASTFLSTVLSNNNIPNIKIHKNVISINTKQDYLDIYNKVEAMKLKLVYPNNTTYSKSLNILEDYYLNILKKNNSKIKKIIISYRDPIERILSLYYYDIYYDFKRKKHDLLQLYFNEWLENSLLKDLNIDKNDSRIIIINSNDVSNFIKSEFNIICNEKINSLSNNDDYYLTINKIKFTKKLITELYNSDPFNKRSIEDIYKIYGSKKGYDNLDFLIRD